MGYLIGGFALVWVANQYMSLFGRLRLDIKRERVEIKEVEKQYAEPKNETRKMPRAVLSWPDSRRKREFIAWRCIGCGTHKFSVYAP